MPALPPLRRTFTPIALLAVLLVCSAAPGTAHAEARRAAQSLPGLARFSPALPARGSALAPARAAAPARTPLARARSGGRDSAGSQPSLARRDERRQDQQKYDQRRYGNDDWRHEFEKAKKREGHHIRPRGHGNDHGNDHGPGHGHGNDHDDSPGC